MLVSPAVAGAQAGSGTFEDIDGQERDFAETYALEFGPERAPPDYLRAAVEGSALLGFGLIWYIAKPNLNSKDWEFDTLAQKVSPSAIRFDDNMFTTNMLEHPISGGGYYGFARLNHIGIPTSLAYAFVGSAMWEYAFEWREKVSINDMIMTPLGGMIIGEWMLKTVEYVSSGPADGTWPKQVARHTLGLPATLHQWLDGPSAADHPMPADELGFSSAYFHDFRLGYSVLRTWDRKSAAATVHALVAASEIVAIPGFLRPGRFGTWFDQGNFTEARLRLGFADQELMDAEVWFRTALFGYYAQDIASSNRAGDAFALSLAGAFTNQQRWLYGRHEDIGILHAIGPAFDGWLTASDVWLRARIETSIDFAGIQPAAYRRFRELHPAGTVDTVLSQYQYAYHFGGSVRMQLLVSYRALELGQRFGFGTYTTITGLARYEEEINQRTRGHELLADYHLWAGISPLPWPLSLRLEFETRMHAGTTESVAVQHVERVMSAAALFRF